MFANVDSYYDLYTHFIKDIGTVQGKFTSRNWLARILFFCMNVDQEIVMIGRERDIGWEREVVRGREILRDGEEEWKEREREIEREVGKRWKR